MDVVIQRSRNNRFRRQLHPYAAGIILREIKSCSILKAAQSRCLAKLLFLVKCDGYVTCPFQARNIFISRLCTRDKGSRKVWKTRLALLLRLRNTLTNNPACLTTWYHQRTTKFSKQEWCIWKLLHFIQIELYINPEPYSNRGLWVFYKDSNCSF